MPRQKLTRIPQRLYNKIAAKACRYADGRLPARGSWTKETAVWGEVYEAFKLGARVGFRLAKEDK